MKTHKFEMIAFAFLLMVFASALLFPAGRASGEWPGWLLLGTALFANLIVLVAG